jgi:hypothetical protein
MLVIEIRSLTRVKLNTSSIKGPPSGNSSYRESVRGSLWQERRFLMITLLLWSYLTWLRILGVWMHSDHVYASFPDYGLELRSPEIAERRQNLVTRAKMETIEH